MKYPENQFSKLKTIISGLSKHFTNLTDIHPAQLHYFCYQQVCEGQLHNRFVTYGDSVVRQHVVPESETFTPLFESDNSFELYPANCMDTHIETAVKKALKEIA
jgi:hypothetical protein